MTPQRASARILTDRLAIVDELLAEIRALPLSDRREFFSDARNVAAAESYLRRSLEALFDAGRHILSKSFGLGVTEYKDIARRLGERGVLDDREIGTLMTLAGYRNRLVHFYHEVKAEELLGICSDQLSDVERIRDAIRRWIARNPGQIDTTL